MASRLRWRLFRAPVIERAKYCVLVVCSLSLMLLVQGCSRHGDFVGLDPDSRSLNYGDKAGGEVGGTVTVYSNQSIGVVRPFLKTGFSGDFSNEHSAPFSNVGAVTLANGTAKVSRSWSAPLLVGGSFPVSAFGMNVPELTAQIYGGAEITRNKASFSLTEAGAPGGPATTASDTWTSVDPAVGAALLYRVGQVNGQPVNFGPSVTVSWMESHSVTAKSSNFALQTYVLNTGNQTDTRVMLNLNVGLNSMLEAGLTGGATW
jgi:hypothetical protein